MQVDEAISKIKTYPRGSYPMLWERFVETLGAGEKGWKSSRQYRRLIYKFMCSGEPQHESVELSIHRQIGSVGNRYCMCMRRITDQIYLI